jgi:hypothetical protein
MWTPLSALALAMLVSRRQPVSAPRARPVARAGVSDTTQLAGADGLGQCSTIYPVLATDASAGARRGAAGADAPSAFVVQRTLDGGDSLYHAVALSLRYAEAGETPGMFWPLLPQAACRMREAAVEALGDASRLLHLGDGATIRSGDLAQMAATRRFGARAGASRDYLQAVYELGEHSGGAELVALANQLRRPCAVYEPFAPREGEVALRRLAAVGAPAFNNASAMHVLALDSLAWRCDDDAVGLVAARADGTSDGAGADQGVRFLALLPARPAAAVEEAPAPIDATERMRARVAASGPAALEAIRAAVAANPRLADAIAIVAREPERAKEFAQDAEVANILALLLAQVRDD